MTAFLDIQEISYTYPDGSAALQKVSLSLEKGKKIAFLGENGAGKSTLFLHLNGILKPTSGRISWNDVPLGYDKKSLLELRRKVGIVFQDPDVQLFSGDVYQEVAFGPLNLGLSDNEVRQRVEEALAAIDIQHLKQKPTHFLSYGEKKRVAIASVVAMQPEVMVFDEPTSFLDPRHTEETFALMDKLNSEGKTIIISTHDVDGVYPWADSFVLLQTGTVAGRGSAEEVFTNSALLKQTGLRQPLILAMFQELQKSGQIRSSVTPPKNREELSRILGEIRG